LTPDAQVAPYLPSDWVLGTGVNSLTFAHFMTHSTGFGQNNVGNTYWELKAGAALPVPSTEFSYKNANFGLMRVAAAGLQGFDPAGLPDDLAGIITSALFIIKAQLLFAGIGASVYSGPSEAFPTIQYKFPDDGTPGYDEPNRSHQVGGYGWFISSNNLANVLANLMGAQTLLSPSMRATMKQEFLGFMDPGNYENWVGVVGDVPGVYYGHGGDWFHAPGELHTCAMAFPINVQAALVINSARGPGMAYQCRVLQTAFDNAWVAP
jgi:CubicO group peptidase (beta-lactamase class C family)